MLGVIFAINMIHEVNQPILNEEQQELGNTKELYLNGNNGKV